MVNAQILAALRTFSIAAEQGSFTAAAGVLCITTGAVSQQIKALELQLGCQLFNRLPRGLALTAEGEQLWRSVSRNLNEISQAVEQLKRNTVEGRVRLRSIPSLVYKWLVPRLGAFQQQYPGIMVEALAEESVLQLSQSDFDLAIDYGFGEYPGFEAELLFEEKLFPVASPDYCHARDWQSDDVWQGVTLLHDSMPWQGAAADAEWRYYLSQLGVEVPADLGGHHFNRADLAIEAASAGLGLALARGSLVVEALESGRLIAPLPAVSSCCSYYLIRTKGGGLTPRVEVLRSWLLAQAKG